METSPHEIIVSSFLFCIATSRDPNGSPAIRITRARSLKLLLTKSSNRAAATLIAVGLAMLFAQACWPSMPMASAAALITLGATFETVERTRRTCSAPAVLATHLFVYAGLYSLIVGAILDASMRDPLDRLTLLQVVDLALSAGLMAFAVRLCVETMIGEGDAPVR
jgi:hypothetical protein